jgi:metal-sulfur cluster biosynthetic enzyme
MTPAEVADALRDVEDPELGFDVVELGLVYEIEVTAGGIRVAMTTTSPLCPMADALLGMAEQVLAAGFPGVSIAVEPISDPPWDLGMSGPRVQAWFHGARRSDR